jgi:hypothetical protein
MRFVYLTIAFRIRHKKILSLFRGLEKKVISRGRGGWTKGRKSTELLLLYGKCRNFQIGGIRKAAKPPDYKWQRGTSPKSPNCRKGTQADKLEKS